MSPTTVRLLHAASEIVGGDKLELPDPLLLRAVDIILADRQSRRSVVAPEVAATPIQELRRGG